MIAVAVRAVIHDDLAAASGTVDVSETPAGFLSTAPMVDGFALRDSDGLAHRRGRFSDDPPPCRRHQAGPFTPIVGSDHHGMWCTTCFWGA